MFYPVTGATALHRAAQRGDEAEVAALLDQVRTLACCPFAGYGQHCYPAEHAAVHAGPLLVVLQCQARQKPGFYVALGRRDRPACGACCRLVRLLPPCPFAGS